MALDMDIDLGHDGSEIIWDGLPDNYSRRNFHIQEIIDFCWKRGILLVPIEPCPASIPPVEGVAPYIIPFENPDERFSEYIKGNIAVFEGVMQETKKRHAVAWDGEKIFDPSGKIVTFHNFAVETCWLIRKDSINGNRST